ncbi:DUF6455 family protein [Roseibium sp.]|uniref:DUF6455 family protein n=1 Tax=Roseibium sp. TaxID=1936156 RepID=UPI003A981D45
MRWMDRMNERADLMGRMLETIGALEHMPKGYGSEQDLRSAATRCLCCSHTSECARWLEANCEGATSPMKDCPNADIFSSWLRA